MIKGRPTNWHDNREAAHSIIIICTLDLAYFKSYVFETFQLIFDIWIINNEMKSVTKVDTRCIFILTFKISFFALKFYSVIFSLIEFSK